MNHADDLHHRLYLIDFPMSRNEEAKGYGAQFDAVLCRWWIDRRTLAQVSGVYRLLEPGTPAYRQAKEAHAWEKRRQPKARATPSRTWGRRKLSRGASYGK